MNEEAIKLLLVDDDEDDYILTRDLLLQVEDARYDIEWIASYREALDAVGNGYDVCLFDYYLGENTGLDLLKEALSSGCTTPVILLTGQGDNGIDVEAIQAGATDYLSKSEITSELLHRSVRYALERKRTDDHIIHMAYYDSLTKLPNRTLFHDRLRKALEYSERYKTTFAMLFLDLDNFKRINDTLEHRIGDLLLQGVADRLSHCVRSADTVARQEENPVTNTIARLGGDEFTILLTDINAMQDAAKVAQRILSILSRPFNLDDHEVFVGASIGIALYPSDGNDVNTLIKNADTAMYHAKDKGRNNFQFYKKSMNATAMDRLKMENSLRRALENEEFSLLYQPKIDISSGCIVGTEALIRWNQPERGIISPGEFIPLAEETGLIIPIGEWVLKTACAQSIYWKNTGSGCTPASIALNLSGIQFRQNDLIKVIEKVIADTGIAPEQLDLEITESVIMQNADSTTSLFQKLKNMGVRLSMDDFGTGYSSFYYLKSFPLDNIKIDRAFINDITRTKKDADIVKAIIAMAHTLELNVIAEGVETQEQLELLQEFECDEMQGFLFCRPLPAEHVQEFLEIWQRMVRG
jgi:diguanylate cyclase (GGDEF)-like protein